MTRDTAPTSTITGTKPKRATRKKERKKEREREREDGEESEEEIERVYGRRYVLNPGQRSEVKGGNTPVEASSTEHGRKLRRKGGGGGGGGGGVNYSSFLLRWWPHVARPVKGQPSRIQSGMNPRYGRL